MRGAFFGRDRIQHERFGLSQKYGFGEDAGERAHDVSMR